MQRQQDISNTSERQPSSKPPVAMSDTSSPRERKLSDESEASAYGDEDLNLANYQHCWDKIYRHTIRQIEQIKGLMSLHFVPQPRKSR